MIPSTTTLKEGKQADISSSDLDFSSPAGKALPSGTLDDTYVSLKRALLEDGITFEVQDHEAGFGLRFTALTDTVNQVHVVSAAGTHDLSLEFDSNSAQASSLHLLSPGDSYTWRMKVEIYPLVSRSSTLQ